MSKDIEPGVTPAPADARVSSQLVDASPYLVAFSLNNPRRRRGLDIDSLSALASSIRTQGLAQPILVRPLPGSRAQDTSADHGVGQPRPVYELICGERRLRASRIAELETIPMLVRHLDDDAALELQLVENIEREDLDPMEEAEGFELLRAKLGYTTEQIAERIGKGKGTSYIYKTMKLLALTPQSREAMYEGHLGRSTGLLVARYPAAQQAEVVSYIKARATSGEPAPYRLVAPEIFRRFNLELGKVVWAIADETLVADAGACTVCPKRTSAHSDLFGDEDNSPDSCTDPDCFEAKRAAHIERVKAEAAKAGFKVIEGSEAKVAIPSPHMNWIMGYSRLSDVAYTQEGNDGKEREVTFEDALRSMGKKAPKARVLIHPFSGEAIQVITEDLAEKLAENAPKPGQPQSGAAGRSTRAPQVQDDRPEDLQALDNYDVCRAVILRIFEAVRRRDRTDAEVLLMAKALFAVQEWHLPLLTTYLNWEADLDVEYGQLETVVTGKLDALPAAEVAAVATMAAMEAALHTLGTGHSMALHLAKSYGVDVLAVRDKVADDLDKTDQQEQRAEDEGGDEPAAVAEISVEPAAAIGARVRMKDSLRSPGGKFRKISGREGELTKELPLGDWMVRCDGGRDVARVGREEFVVLPAAAAEAVLDDAARKISPVAAWPFPVAKRGKVGAEGSAP